MFALWYGHDLTIFSPPQHGTSAQIQNIQYNIHKSKLQNYPSQIPTTTSQPPIVQESQHTLIMFHEFRVFPHQFCNLQPALSRGDHIIIHPSSSRHFGQNHVNIQLPLQVHDATRWHFQRNQARYSLREGHFDFVTPIGCGVYDDNV